MSSEVAFEGSGGTTYAAVKSDTIRSGTGNINQVYGSTGLGHINVAIITGLTKLLDNQRKLIRKAKEHNAIRICFDCIGNLSCEVSIRTLIGTFVSNVYTIFITVFFDISAGSLPVFGFDPNESSVFSRPFPQRQPGQIPHS